MSKPSWQLAERWLLAALDQPTETRARFLYEKISDPVLRARVESLVAADARCGTFLEAPAHAMLMPELPAVGRLVSGLAIPDSESAQPLRNPTRIGSYRLVRELGQGGMSVVYLGERITADFEQRVAVKLLRAGALSDDMRRRFRAERQILAQLEHPAIARLLDGGTTDTGLPYLVMDYVIGLPIDRYCDSKRLDVRARVRCFLEVCAAVRHAHRNLVVHRDIKPSNILVGEDGKPKLLDFGIAKLITAAPDGAAASEVTATCQRMLTPNYASPEQLRGEAITTAWDVYALGVLLYRLLTGSLPHRLEGRTFEAMWRQLQAGHPPIPSAAVVAGSSMEGAHCWQDRHGSRHRGQAGHPVAGSRGFTTTRQLARKLRGDLDTITMTALHRDPDRRYGSVDALIDDLERYQDGRPVWARRDSVLYRAGKFVVRQRLAVAVTLAFVLLTAGFAIDRARSAWQLERERDEKEEVATFLVSLFETQGEGPETEVQARSLLDRGVAQATARLDTQPGVGASLLHAIAQAYFNLGFYDDAVAAFQQAQTFRGQILGVDPARRAETLHGLGLAYHRAADYEASASAYEEALAIRRSQFGTPSSAVAESLHAQAWLAHDLGDYARSLALAEQAWDMRRTLFGEAHAETAQSKTIIAIARWELGEYETAEASYREALAVLRVTVGPQASVADALSGLAILYQQRDDPLNALPLVDEALAIRARVFGTEHPIYFKTLQTLGIAAASTNDYPRAERAFREALAATEQWFDAQHVSVGRAMMNLGAVLVKMERFGEAGAYLERAVAIGKGAVGERHPRVALAQAGLAVALGHTAREVEAESMFRQALAVLDASLGVEHPATALVRADLADLLARTGALRRADALFASALPVVRGMRPESPLETAARELTHARVLTRLGQTSDAWAAAERARQTFAERLGPDSDRVHEVDLLFATLGSNQQLASALDPMIHPSR